VFRHGVHLFGELAFLQWPSRLEALIGLPPQEQRFSFKGLLEFEGVQLGNPKGHGPARMRMRRLAARRLDDSVERDEFGDDQLPHCLSSRLVCVY
jgi:hypothetical protein